MEFYHNKPHRTMKDNFLSEKKTEKKLLTEQQNITSYGLDLWIYSLRMHTEFGLAFLFFVRT